MPVASFAADFSEFSTEVQKAEKDLESFEQETAETGAALEKLSGTSQKGAAPVGNLSKEYKHFDSLLSSAGINIGPTVKAIEEMGMASGKTATQFGLLGTAGLAVGTFLATFNLTKSILEFTGLNTVIGNVVDSIHDFGLSAQEAGAKQDTINLAIKNGAAEGINYAQAVAYMNTVAADRKVKAKEAAEADKEWAEATKQLITFGEDWRTTLETMDGAVVEAVKHYLEAGVSQDTLKKAYMLTEGQIKSITASMKAEEEQHKALAKAREAEAAAMKQYGDDFGAVVDKIFGAEALQKASTWLNVMDNLGIEVASLSSTELAELEATMLAGIDSLARMGRLTDEQSTHFANLAIQAAAAQAALKPVVEVTEDLVKAQWDHALATDAALAAMKKTATEAEQITATAKAGAGASAGAGVGIMRETDAGGVGRDLFGRPVVNAFTSGLAPTMGITINVDGSVISNSYELSRTVGDAITASFRRGGSRLPG